MKNEYPMLTLFYGKPLVECSNGEIVNALRHSSRGLRQSEIFGDVVSEAVKREILPAAMWLVEQ